ncbi:E3 ubiquitin-protein ligase RNF168-like [Amphibalanus amphitrite]|uniref:E3 ubiquitin-protein ligase RNF168-like n=1 Tax=Amphibalanus amphitrite TaxID=1232801 RepID=UPI001C909759|nr:E3 ubiquitin-protein ligase RNF168-like [Amphibalanus amphitrite]
MSRRRRGAVAAPAAAEEPLTTAAATCPVCLSVLLEPVTMPCRHTLCRPCFDSTVEQSAMSCPLCRTRISVWLRRARRAGTLVDEALWARLKTTFPDKVQARLEGREADFSEEDLEPVPQLLSAPGEIRREFEQQLEAVRDEEAEIRSRSERASRELIERLEQETAEEARRRLEQERSDAELARGVMQQDEVFLSPGRPALAGDRPRPGAGGAHRPSSSSTPLRGPMDVYIGQMTPRVGGKRPVSPIRPHAAAGGDDAPPPALDSTPSPTGSGKENSDPSAAGGRCSPQSSGSGDSIRAELRHFKPIRSAPRTPPKRRPDGVLGAPPVVHAVARFQDRPEGPGRTAGGQRAAREGAEDTGAAGDSGENVPATAAGKRPAEEQLQKRKPTKRRPPPTADEVDGDSRELPVLAPPPPPAPGAEHDSDFDIDLDSAELLEQQREAERRLEMEQADRRLAEQLQRELNTAPPVDRSKGSADAYSLRGAAGEHSGTQTRSSGRPTDRRRPAAASGGRKRPAAARKQTNRRDRAQLSIQESLNRSRVSARSGSPEW